MTRLEALKALAEKVEAGLPNQNDGTLYTLFGDAWVHCWDIIDRGSLDAAKALHESVLPGWDWLARNEPCGTHSQIGFANVTTRDFSAYAAVCDERGNTVSKGEVISGASFPVYSETPARAWLLAILRALIAQEAAE